MRSGTPVSFYVVRKALADHVTSAQNEEHSEPCRHLEEEYPREKEQEMQRPRGTSVLEVC